MSVSKVVKLFLNEIYFLWQNSMTIYKDFWLLAVYYNLTYY